MRQPRARGVVCALALTVAALCSGRVAVAQDGESQGPPPASVRTGIAKVETVQNKYRVIGRLREARKSIVAAEEAGRVLKMHVIEGSVLSAGDPIIEIDAKTANLELARAEAALLQAQAELKQADALVDERRARYARAKSDLTYLEQLFKSGSAKQRELDDARAVEKEEAAAVVSTEAQQAARKATVSARQADVDLAKESVERLTVYAPFDGYVVTKQTEQGQWVAVGDAVVLYYSRGVITGLVDVPERLVNYLEPGAPIDIVVDPLGGERMAGTVKAVIPDGSSAARTFPVTLSLDDQKGRLKPGMSIQAWVPLGTESERVTVPRDAVAQSPHGTAVWANMDGRAVQLKVKVAFGIGDRYAIDVLPGGPPLPDGTEVVVEGAERILFPGQPLMVIPGDLPMNDPNSNKSASPAAAAAKPAPETDEARASSN